MKFFIRDNKRTLLTLAILLWVVIGLSAAQLMQWKPTFIGKDTKVGRLYGTKRVLKEGKSSVFYYRSLPGSPLDFGTVNQAKLRISVFSKKDSLKFKYTVIVDKEKKSFEVQYRRKVGNYYCFEDIYLNLLPGSHKIMISTSNRNVYFRAFYPKFKKIYPPLSLAKPAIATDTIHLNKGTATKAYYIATADKPYQIVLDDRYKVYGYARASLVNKAPSSFEIYRNGLLLKKVDISPKKSKLYQNPKFQNLSIGKKFDIPLVAGKNVIVLKPVGSNPVIFRIFKERKTTS
jgi:hypothetical protein